MTDIKLNETPPSNNTPQHNTSEPHVQSLHAFALIFEHLSYHNLRTCALVSKDFHKATKDVFKARYNRNIGSYPSSITDGKYDKELCTIIYVPPTVNNNHANTTNNNSNNTTPRGTIRNTDGYVRMIWKGYATSKQYRRMHVDLLNAQKIYGVSGMMIDASESKIIGIEDQSWIAQNWFEWVKGSSFRVTRVAVLNSKFLFSRAGIENIYNKSKQVWSSNDDFQLRHAETFLEAESFLLTS